MTEGPAWTIWRQYRRLDGTVQTVVRCRGGRLVSVVAPAASSSGDQITALIDATLQHVRTSARPATYEE